MAANDERILSDIDWERMNRIAKFQEMNSEIICVYADYLRNHPAFITKELVDDLVHECSVSQEYAFYVLLQALCGIDADHDPRDRELANEYLLPSIKRLDADHYRENTYYKNIKIPQVKFKNWELKYESYVPYEGFIYKDIELGKDYKEIPKLGFFTEEFRFPAVLESNVEWMTITPNEIETMQPVIDMVKGNVITFGLGLGYFAYMASMKEEVNKVTVVERDEKVIELFCTYILPQFQFKEKVEIIPMDAFEFAEKHLENENFSYAFVDLWHDASDGFLLYLQMKNYEKICSETVFQYWIEPSFLSQLRSYSFLAILRLKKKSCVRSPLLIHDMEESISVEKKIQIIMQCIIEEETSHTKPVDYYLSDEFLQRIGQRFAEIYKNPKIGSEKYAI